MKEENLRQLGEISRTYLENAPDGVYASNLKGTFLYGNKKAEEITGYKREELIGKSFLDLNLLSAKQLARVGKLLALSVIGRTTGPDEIELIKKDGSHIWTEITTTPIKQGGEAVVVGFVRDITERKQAEHNLQERVKELTCLYGISQFAARTDISLDEILEGTVNLIPPGWQYPEITCARVILNGKEFETDNFKVTEWRQSSDIKLGGHKVGTLEVYYLEEKAEANEGPFLQEERNLIDAIARILRDTTGRKRMEEEKREARQKAQVSNRLATVGQMASGIAHEINNPLTGVVGFAQLLQKRDIPEDVKKEVAIIHDGAQRVASIVQRLLIFARQQTPERESININETVATTVAMRAYEMETGNIAVTMQLAPDLPNIIADNGQLQQVFLNIILNAEEEMESTHSGGNLLIKTEKVDNTIRISFEDDGPGISQEDLERIFDPFFTTRAVGKGTGLGLSICYGIVTEHGGEIYAESELGKGATFIVELPIVTESKELEPAEPVAVEAKSEAKTKILVVDDEPIVRDFVSAILTDAGHEVETADSASDALEKLENKRYSLILLDIKMRGMSGIELYRHLQKKAKSFSKRVVFITGDIMGKDTWQFLRKTKAPYLTKPFSEEQLQKEIYRVLTQGEW